MIKTVDSLNTIFLENSIDAKVVLLIRTDIFALLNDTDLNKIKRINTIDINWGNRVDKDSPLIQLILKKAKKSSSYLANMNDREIFHLLFPQDIKRVSPERFILERTLFRPRDVITLLNFIIKRYPNSRFFGWKGFMETKADYSEYFMDEIRNEMVGHLDNEEIEQGLRLLKNFNYHFFKFDDLREYYKAQKSHYPLLDLEKILKIFFKFNIVGNRWFNKFKNKIYYSWAHRDVKAEIDFSKEIVIHLGLREELSM